MRLIAIPIARARPGVTPVSTFLAQRTPIKPSSFVSQAPPRPTAETSKAQQQGRPEQIASTSSTLSSTPQGKAAVPDQDAERPPLSKRILDRASKFWMDLGREDQTSTFDWKRRTYTAGERLMDQIEYEEWALKGVDPALGPSLAHPTGKKEAVEAAASPSSARTSAASRVTLLYPSKFLQGGPLLSSIAHLTQTRQPHHRQRLIWCLIGMPITAPFALVPVIPNLPFFYLVWRAWSHWRAYQSSKYLSDLIKRGLVIPQASDELDRIFSLPSPPPTAADKSRDSASNTDAGASDNVQPTQQELVARRKKEMDDANVEQLMILKPHHITTLAKTFNMDRQLSVDLARARLQTIKAIRSDKLDKLEAAVTQDKQNQE